MTEQRISSTTVLREPIVVTAHLDTSLRPTSPGADDAAVQMRRTGVGTPDLCVLKPSVPRERFSAGPIQFTATHFTVDGATHALANTVAKPEQLAQAGKRGVPPSDGHSEAGELIIQGPQFGTPEARSKRPGIIGGWLQRLLVRFNFGRADNWQNRLRLRERPYTDFTPIEGRVMDANFKKWGMQAGDWLLVGDTHCGHLQVYVGDNDKGQAQIVHSMATKYENKSFRVWARVLVEMLLTRLFLWRRLDKTGVFQEGLAEYFDRNVTGAAIAMRDPRLTPEMRAHFLKLVDGDKDKDYNGNLIETTKRIYCSQLAAKNLIATYKAFGLTPPQINTCRVHHAQGKFYEMDAYVATPENMSVSPDFVVLGCAGHGKNDVVQNLKTMVRPER